jgi:pilus assembly protein CpaB
MKTSFLKNQNLRLILISLLLGLVAALLSRTYIVEAIQSVTGGKLVQVVFAAHNIRARTPIQSSDIEMRSIPESYFSGRVIRWAMRNLLIGQTLQNDLLPGQGILWTDIHLAEDVRLVDRLPFNERAVTIKVDQTGALDGMISPGNRVDIVVQTRSQGGQITKMVAQNMTIIAVDNRLTSENPIQAGPNNSQRAAQNGASARVSSVTFRASPADAMMLAFAETQGRIVLLLRNEGDIFSQPVPELSSRELATAKPFTNPQSNEVTPGFPMIYEPGSQPRPGNLPSADDLANKLKSFTPEDARKQLLQQFKERTEGNAEQPPSTQAASPSDTPNK